MSAAPPQPAPDNSPAAKPTTSGGREVNKVKGDKGDNGDKGKQIKRVIMARFGAPHGIRGWVRFRPHTDNPLMLAGRDDCWAAKSGGEFMPMKMDEVRKHGGGWLAKMTGCDDRDQAQQWRGGCFAVCRSSLPPLPDGGFYWCDLLGLKAYSPKGAAIGEVADMMEAGGAVLVIRKAGGGELLAPFVDEYVPEVDIIGGRIVVDMPDAV